MRIKEEYKGKTLVINDGVLGELRIEVNKIKPSQRSYVMGMGLGHIFETEKFIGIEEKPKKTRTKKVKPVIDEEE